MPEQKRKPGRPRQVPEYHTGDEAKKRFLAAMQIAGSGAKHGAKKKRAA